MRCGVRGSGISYKLYKQLGSRRIELRPKMNSGASEVERRIWWVLNNAAILYIFSLTKSAAHRTAIATSIRRFAPPLSKMLCRYAYAALDNIGRN